MRPRNHAVLTWLLSLALAVMPFASMSADIVMTGDMEAVSHCHEMDLSAEQDTTINPSQDCCCHSACQCAGLINCQLSSHTLSFVMAPLVHTTLPTFSDEPVLNHVDYYRNRITTPDIRPPIA